jgi:hypothetical protein
LATPAASGYSRTMARTQQTFINRKDQPIYVSVEPWPKCFELETGDELTLIWDAPETGEAAQVHFLNERELVIYPEGNIGDIVILFNGGPSESRSWVFKHQ